MLSKGGKRFIGLAAIAAGVLIVVLGVAQPNPFKTTTTYWVELDSVQGLGAIGRDVRVAGVNVGTIGDVEREGDDARVELILSTDIELKQDARVEMRPHTLFEGSSFVDLAPGSPSAPTMESGETIPIEQTSNYVTLDEALRVLRPEIRESLRDLAATGSKTLRGQAVMGVQRILRNAPELTARLGGPVRELQGPTGTELAGSIQGMARTVDAVATREEQLIPLAQRLNRTTAALTVDGAQPLDATLAALPGALGELQAGAPELTGLVDRLDRLAGDVNPALPALTEALAAGRPLLEDSIPVLRRVRPVVSDLRKIAARLAAASPTLEQLIRSLDPVTKVFGESVLPTLTETSRRGEPTYEQLMATFSDANAVFSPYQTEAQNPQGGGHAWNITTYLNPTAALGALPLEAATPTACADVEAISAEAAARMRAGGTCR